MTEAITLKNLKKEYKNVSALHDLTLSIGQGEFFGLLGPNGAGKTTTINILTGLCNKTSGSVSLFGKDVVSDYEEARALIGLVPQEFNMDFFKKPIMCYTLMLAILAFLAAREQRKSNVYFETWIYGRSEIHLFGNSLEG